MCIVVYNIVRTLTVEICGFSGSQLIHEVLSIKNFVPADLLYKPANNMPMFFCQSVFVPKFSTTKAMLDGKYYKTNFLK